MTGRPLSLWARWCGIVAADDDLSDRLGLLLLASLVWDVGSSQTNFVVIPGMPASAVALPYVSFGVMLILITMASRQPLWSWVVSQRPRRLIVAAPLLMIIIAPLYAARVAGTVAAGVPGIADSSAVTVCAADAIVHGNDPYAMSEPRCLRSLGVGFAAATPLPIGRLAKVRVYPNLEQLHSAFEAALRAHQPAPDFPPYGYPPMAAVWMMPTIHLGRASRVGWVMLFVVLVGIAAGAAAGPLWPAALAVLLLQLAPASILSGAMSGNGEAIADALAALGLLWISNPRRSGILIGLAVVSNELAWFMAVGYLLASRRLPGWRSRFMVTCTVTAIAMVPWILLDPRLIPAMWRFLTEPTFAVGLGLVALRTGGWAPRLGQGVMNALAAFALVGVVMFGVRTRRWARLAAVLPVAILWLSWRSEVTFLSAVPLMALVAVLGLPSAELAARSEQGTD